MARRTGPTLYEAMSQSTPSSASSGARGGRGTDSERPSASALLTPGRGIRFPVGFVWIGLAGVIGLVVATYLFGFSRGERAAGARQAATLSAELEAAREAGRVREPAQTAVPGRQDPPVIPEAAVGSKPSENRRNADPRVPGVSYWVVMRPRPDRAEEVAAFIRENGRGLDAAVIPSDTGGFPKVIVLPGFRSEERSTPRIESMKDEILRIGRAFGKQTGGKGEPFADLYPETFKSSSD
ncbi:MAG: hypothetical protein CBB69_007130 [Phycisphaera sp. TMED9]|nr:MAG: hypothetical protein CBB69_007130 [Phycisphaera sp. TMED9]